MDNGNRESHGGGITLEQVYRNMGGGVEPYTMTDADRKNALLVCRTDAKTEQEVKRLARQLVFECVVVLGDDGASIYRIE